MILHVSSVFPTPSRSARGMSPLELFVQEAHDPKLERLYRLIFDVVCATDTGERFAEFGGAGQAAGLFGGGKLGHRGDVQIQRVSKVATNGAVRADVFASISQSGKGIHADECRTFASGPIHQISQIAEIARAPVPSTVERVQIHPISETLPAAELIDDGVTTSWHDNQALSARPFSPGASKTYKEFMISERRRARRRQTGVSTPRGNSPMSFADERLSVFQTKLNPPIDAA